MNPALIMNELGDACRVIDGLRVHDQPVGSITPPALIVLYPETIDFDATYGRGSDKIAGGFLVVVGKPFDRATKDLIGAYASGDGDKSIKQAIESYNYTSCDDVRLASIQFDVVTIGSIEYMAGVGDLEIIGQGRSAP